MNVKDFNLKKTALLFFDILNGYVAEPEPGQPRLLKPWIQNAVRLSKAGRAAGLPVFFAKGNHRPDNATTALTTHRHQQLAHALAQWRGDKNQNARHRRRQKLRRARRPGTEAGRLLHREIPLERVLSNLSRSRPAQPRHRHADRFRRLHRCRRHLDFVFGPRLGL